ncbi:hypothetical protein PI124_g23890 [Phytophthora idaei]|nr:hypothetical protein PI125_g26088 [Phytophthora idaei]KAG3137593.1 hypothetical protein PI126_g17320 [Phytophthora idaei]KAG3231015.1 hypothetical protein PI124_g23890 [Phytophthora idaei]
MYQRPVHEAVSGVGHRASPFVRPELIVEPPVPSYPVEPLPFVPKTTDWLAEAAALERRQPWRAAWVFVSFDHPYNTTYVPCHHHAPIFCSRTADPIAIGRAIMTDPSLTPAQLAPDWQRRFFSAPGTPRQSSVAASADGNDGSSASEAPPVVHASPLDEEEKDSGGLSSPGLLADAADRMTSS